MSEIKVGFGARFIKDLDYLQSKYRQIDLDKIVEALVSQLKRGERPGDKIPRVGHDVYKVRLKNPAAGRGKSGGFRAIYYVQMADLIYLITLYSKTERENISPEALRRIIDELGS